MYVQSQAYVTREEGATDAPPPTDVADVENYDGANYNKISWLYAEDGLVKYNFEQSSLACRVLGLGCKSVEKAVDHSLDRLGKYVIQASPYTGAREYRNGELVPLPTRNLALSLQDAMAEDTCKALTKTEAVTFLCQRQINNPKIITKSLMYYGTHAEREVGISDFPIWRECVQNVILSHDFLRPESYIPSYAEMFFSKVTLDGVVRYINQGEISTYNMCKHLK
jgi:hypothetical protein